jgi:UDP-N-acetyl-D-galactosamine dehydrogenase
MVTAKTLLSGEDKLAVVGLGYVGLPLALAFARKLTVIGIDISSRKIDQLCRGIDITAEVGSEGLAHSIAEFTDDIDRLTAARFVVVTVPTPIDCNKKPDLGSVISASEMIGKSLQRGSIVVYESTVYPGVTEDICVPILERESGLTCGADFKVGYSPERINPGDKVHTLEKITKVVSGQDAESLETIAEVYELVVTVGTHRAPSIKVAEAAKVIENTQRDLNIALMNELSLIFNRMDISTRDVLAAAGTKWNFLPFHPGLVGGHCIGVDPYYLTFKAQELGYHPQVILSGRMIHDGMGKHVAETTIKKMIQADKAIKGSRVLVLGLTFKENVPDIRNSKVVDIVRELEEYGVEVLIHDPIANKDEARRVYGVELVDIDGLDSVDTVVWAVSHECFKDIDVEQLRVLCSRGNARGVICDVKSILDPISVESAGLLYWSL